MIIDISYEITNCNIYPGDPKPSVNVIKDMNNGDSYNLSTFRKLSENPRLLNCRDESLYKFYQKQLLTLNY